MSLSSPIVPMNILLVEDDPGDALLIRDMLQGEADCAPDITQVESLAEMRKALVRKNFDVALLDLSLPDSAPVDTVARADQAVLSVPIIVLTCPNSEMLIEKIVYHGIQDYLIKGQIDCRILGYSIRYAIEQKRLALENERLIACLRKANDHLKILRRLRPICADCNKRDSQRTVIAL